MTRVVSWLAVLYVALLPVGRSGLPLNAQWGDLLFPLLAVAALRGVEIGRWWRREDWPLAAYLAVTLLTSLVSPEPLTGLKHLAKQAYVAAVFVVFRRLSADAPLTLRLQKTFVAVVAAITTISIVVVFLRVARGLPLSMFGATDALPFLGVVRRLRGAFVTPELLGNALLVGFVFAIALRAIGDQRSRRRWTAIAALLGAGSFLTYSHSVAGFAVAAVLFTGGSLSSRFVRSLAWFGAASVVIVVNAASVVDAGTQSNDYSVGRVSFNLLGTRVEGGLVHYAALKQVAWSAFLEHPLKGVGPGRFAAETERAFQEGRLTARYRNKSPHCDPTGRLAEAGIVGGLSLLALWASWVHVLGRGLSTASAMRRAGFAAVVGILVNSLNADVMNFRFLWIALAWASVPTGASAQATTRAPTLAASAPIAP